MYTRTSLTPDEKLRAAYSYFILGIEQHHIATIFGCNSGRIAEAVASVRLACGFTDKDTKGFNPISQQKSM